MDNNIKKCISDSDCDDNNICAFNNNEMDHYCVSNNINDLYYGCMDNNITNIDSVESKSNLDHMNYKNCINFSRRQLNNEGLEYNYMVFKPKKNAYVDTSTINIYLKCEDEILAIIPYNDYFNLRCDENRENCILESKESLLNFIVQNSTNCNKKLYLEVIYECENEGIKKNDKIPVYLDNFKDIKIKLKCPIDDNNSKFKSKCEAVYINNFDKQNNINELIDIKKSLYECKNPVYNVPILTKNINNYKKIKSKYSNLELKDYDNKINEKINDLKKLEAEKYIKLKKIQTGGDVTMEEAYDAINNYSLDKLVNNSKEKWKLYNGYDAVQNLFNDNENNNTDNQLIKYYGKVYTIDDAIKVANENEQNFFVWYNNSYELDNFASKLYFIDIYNIDEDIYNKTNWVKHESVTTGILKYDFEHFTDENNVEDEKLYNTLMQSINEQNSANEELKNSYLNIIQNLDIKNLNNVIIKNLDDKITQYGQSISMNNYETNINNKIIIALTVILFFIFVILVVVIVFYNNKTAGKIKLMGM